MLGCFEIFQIDEFRLVIELKSIGCKILQAKTTVLWVVSYALQTGS